MPGRKAGTDINIQLQLFKENSNKLVVDHEQVGLSNEIYQDLGKKLDMTKKAVYLSVQKHLSEICELRKLNDLNYTTDISNSKIFNIKVDGNGRKCVGPDWSGLLAEKLWQITKKKIARGRLNQRKLFKMK